MKLNFRDLFCSFWQLTRHVIFARKADVLFYYPQHFNRSAKGTNPFFDKLLETCDNHGIRYKLIEEPDWGTDKPRNPKAVRGDVMFWTIMVLRKIVSLVYRRKSFYYRERIVARMFNILSFGRFQTPVYITISGSMYHLFAALNPKAKVFDMQHGVLYKGHLTFFDGNERLHPQFYQQNLHWLMWGEGYKGIFERGEEDVLHGRVHVIGYPIEQPLKETGDKEKTVLLSLQFTHDWEASALEKYKKLLADTLQQFAGTGYRVLLRHHPRFNNVINIDDLLAKYDFADITNLSFEQLVIQISLHVTYNSTTAFEYAQYGIPSVFMSNADFPHSENIFYKEYNYPLFRNADIVETLQYLENNDVSDDIKGWYKLFYAPFNQEMLLRLIK